MRQKCLDLFEKARNNPAGLRFSELKALCVCAGFKWDRTSGSHLIFKREVPFRLLSIQNMPDGKAKPYQVRQLINFIEAIGLDREE